MKKYILAVVAFLFVGANASENPFAVNQNLQKIEEDQAVLLKELSVVAEKLEAEADAADDAEIDDEGDDDNTTEDEEETPATEAVTADNEVAVPVEEMSSTAKSDAVAEVEKKEIETTPEAPVEDNVTAEEDRLKKVQEDQARIEDERAKEEALQEEKAKLEAEKLALEKLAAEQLAQEELEKKKREEEAELAKLKVEKEQLEKEFAAEEAAKKEASDVKAANEKTKEEKVAVTQAPAAEAATADMKDVNLTREAETAAIQAEEEYKNAISAVD